MELYKYLQVKNYKISYFSTKLMIKQNFTGLGMYTSYIIQSFSVWWITNPFEHNYNAIVIQTTQNQYLPRHLDIHFIHILTKIYVATHNRNIPVQQYFFKILIKHFQMNCNKSDLWCLSHVRVTKQHHFHFINYLQTDAHLIVYVPIKTYRK